jgi:hypothetical protein
MAIRTGFPLALGAKSSSGPFGVNVTLDFTTGNVVSGDLVQEQMIGTIDYVQSIWIDNSQNTKVLTITFPGLGQSITVKANTQGLYPVIAQQGPIRWTATSVGAAVVVPVIMMNVPQQSYSQWATV